MKLGTRKLLGYTGIPSLLPVLAIDSIAKVNGTSSDLHSINAVNVRGNPHNNALLMRQLRLSENQMRIPATREDIQRRVTAHAASSVALDPMKAANMAVTRDEPHSKASIKQTEARTLPLMAGVTAAAAGLVSGAANDLPQRAEQRSNDVNARVADRRAA